MSSLENDSSSLEEKSSSASKRGLEKVVKLSQTGTSHSLSISEKSSDSLGIGTRGKKERIKSIALKAKKESSDDETLTSKSNDEEYAMAIRNFKKFFRRKGKFVRQPREEKKSFRQRDEKKGKSDRKFLYADEPNLSLAIVQTISQQDQKKGPQ
ncbi:hypothetical protein Tco_1375503 [Tanacetum coccineum]